MSEITVSHPEVDDSGYICKFFEALCGSDEIEQLFGIQKTGGPMIHLRGTPEALHPALKKYNETGHNIYFTVNRVDGLKRRAPDVIDVRAFFTDADNGFPDFSNFEISPNILVNSKNGPHHYFLPSVPPPKEYFGIVLRNPAQVGHLFRSHVGHLIRFDVGRVIRPHVGHPFRSHVGRF